MKKSIIALAVAAAVAAPAAMADTTLYGKFHTSIDSVEAMVDKGEDQDSVASVTSRSSRLGIKGSENLGGSLKAIFKMETEFQSDGNQDAAKNQLATRNTYVGLAGSFGKVLAGRHDTPEKKVWYIGNQFVDQIGDYVGLFKNDNDISSARQNNVLQYWSPSFSGFSFALSNEFSEVADGDDTVSANVMYKGYGVVAGLGTATKGDAETVTAGLSFAFMGVKLGLAYSDGKDAAGNDYDDAAMQLSGSYKLGAGKIKASYAERGEAKLTAVGYDHSLSKRTTVYGQYAMTENEGMEDGTGISFGIIHNF